MNTTDPDKLRLAVTAARDESKAVYAQLARSFDSASKTTQYHRGRLDAFNHVLDLLAIRSDP